jgi:hypothetical protein
MASLRTVMKRTLTRTGLWPSANRVPVAMSELDAREAYRLWAPTYSTETATSFLDEELAQEMLDGLPRT